MPDVIDDCPDDADKTSPGACGCGKADADTDNDGTADCKDGCPNDSAKTAAGVCGCGAGMCGTGTTMLAPMMLLCIFGRRKHRRR